MGGYSKGQVIFWIYGGISDILYYKGGIFVEYITPSVTIGTKNETWYINREVGDCFKLYGSLWASMVTGISTNIFLLPSTISEIDVYNDVAYTTCDIALVAASSPFTELSFKMFLFVIPIPISQPTWS